MYYTLYIQYHTQKHTESDLKRKKKQTEFVGGNTYHLFILCWICSYSLVRRVHYHSLLYIPVDGVARGVGRGENRNNGGVCVFLFRNASGCENANGQMGYSCVFVLKAKRAKQEKTSVMDILPQFNSSAIAGGRHEARPCQLRSVTFVQQPILGTQFYTYLAERCDNLFMCVYINDVGHSVIIFTLSACGIHCYSREILLLQN